MFLILTYFFDIDAKAKDIVEPYVDYPVLRWRNLFCNVLVQLNEMNGETAIATDSEARSQQNNEQAKKQETLDFHIEGKNIIFTYQHVSECTLHYHLMDIELLFSKRPFVQKGAAQLSWLKANYSEKVSLPETGEHQHTLPPQYQSSNLVLEVIGGGTRRSQVCYANNLMVRVVEEYGQIRVYNRKSKSPLHTTYIKVYARKKDNSVQFYKDGYTDYRGFFDYTGLSTDDLTHVSRFSILVLHDEHGAVIREANPPVY